MLKCMFGFVGWKSDRQNQLFARLTLLHTFLFFVYSTNPEKIFDVFTTLSYSPTDAKDVQIESKIPSHYGAEDILKQIPKFAYPCAYNR